VAFRNPAITFGVLTFHVIDVGDGTVLLSELRHVCSTARGLLPKLWNKDYLFTVSAAGSAELLFSHIIFPSACVHRSIQGRDWHLARCYRTLRRWTVRRHFRASFLFGRLSLYASQSSQLSKHSTKALSHIAVPTIPDLELLRFRSRLHNDRQRLERRVRA
jgi:hypothetical protein